jgi:hypothetical protein
MRIPIFFITALGLVVDSAPGVRADICFQYQTGGAPVVAKGAKLPAPESCEPLALFEAARPDSRFGAANALLCRDSGSILTYHYDYDACLGLGSYSESATCRLQLGNNNDLPTNGISCNGQYFALMPFQTGPAKQFTDPTLRAFYCNEPVPGYTVCNGSSKPPFTHPQTGESESPETKGRGQ